METDFEYINDEYPDYCKIIINTLITFNIIPCDLDDSAEAFVVSKVQALVDETDPSVVEPDGCNGYEDAPTFMEMAFEDYFWDRHAYESEECPQVIRDIREILLPQIKPYLLINADMGYSSGITKIKYVANTASKNTACKERTAYTISPDGRVKIRHYLNGTCDSSKTVQGMSRRDYSNLCKEINECITFATTSDSVYDHPEITGKVTLYRNFGRVETMDSGFGSYQEGQNLGDILAKYIGRMQK